MSNAEELRRVAIFADLADADLEWLATTGRFVSLAPGDAVISEGTPADTMVALIEGEVRATREKPPSDGRVFIVKAGQVGGMLPFSRLETFPVTGRAVVPSHALLFPAAAFPEMLRRIPVLESRLVARMADRVRESAQEDHKRETLIALGKLSAGLAHELNNPAAAAGRAAAELGRHLAHLPALAVPVSAAGLDSAACAAVAALVTRAAVPLPASPAGSLERADIEDEIMDWLDERGVDEPGQLAGTFAERGLAVADLEALAAAVPADALPAALPWAEALISASVLARDIEQATGRISQLVAAVKSYSRMDRAPAKAETDVHESLEATLTILAHKLSEKNITLVRSFAPDLPRVAAFAGELNQVWTNLIDNAVDAVAPGGRIEVRTARGHDDVLVEIIDNGAGIAPENLGRIYEPFFTTKPVGQGTGLGLDIAHRIVTRRHAGELRVDSRPGETRFQVRLPAPPTQPQS